MTYAALAYLDPREVIAVKQTEAPHHRSRTGYGNDIPTSWLVRMTDKRWRRIYVILWSNSGTAYVKTAKGNLYLGAWEPTDFVATKPTGYSSYCYTLRHKMSGPPTVSYVDLPDKCFDNCKTLASALRTAGLLEPGNRLTHNDWRLEGEKVIVIMPLRSVWHSLTLVKE